VDVIDLTTNTVITSIPLANGPSEIAITPDGHRAYVLTQAFQKAFVIDLTTNTLLTTISLGFNPFGIVAAPDRQHVSIAKQSLPGVGVIDLSGPAGIAP
jgi:YVTN family beta-propeller protein